MQQGGAFTRHATGFVAVVLGIVVQKPRLDLFERFPGDVSRVHPIHANLPFVQREVHLLGTRGSGIASKRAGPSVDKGSGVGRVFEHLQKSCNGGFLPDEIPKAVTTRQAQLMRVEELQDQAFRAQAQKGAKDEVQAILHLPVGIGCRTRPMASRSKPMGNCKASSPRCADARATLLSCVHEWCAIPVPRVAL